MKNNERIYYLDALRSFLIILVVLVHASRVYDSNQTWLISSEHNSIFINYLVNFLGLLIMPTFFIVAGYFAVVSFNHNYHQNFLSKRLGRLLIPLITVAFSLNFLQAYILVYFGWKDYGLFEYFSHGDWIQHLWFLINLIVYTLIVYMMTKYFKSSTKRFLLNITDKLRSISIYVTLSLLPMITIFLLIFFKIIPGYIFSINVNQIFIYMPYFFFGILLAMSKELLDKFSNIRFDISLTLVIICFVIMKQLDGLEFIGFKIAFFYVKTLGIWFIAACAFTIFRKFFNIESNLIYKISDASYSIYLIHHVIVISIGLLFIYINLHAFVGLPLLFTITLAVSYVIHRKIIMKSKLLGLLFNGQKK